MGDMGECEKISKGGEKESERSFSVCIYAWASMCLIYNGALRRYVDLTHAQEQALVLLDGTQATEKARYHDDGADGDDHVGSRQRGE